MKGRRKRRKVAFTAHNFAHGPVASPKLVKTPVDLERHNVLEQLLTLEMDEDLRGDTRERPNPIRQVRRCGGR